MFCVPAEGLPGERCGFSRGAEQSPAGSAWMVFLSERFLFFLPGEAFFTPTGNLLSASERHGGACIMRYSGREEERAPSIYRSSVFVVLSDGGEGAPLQSFLKGLGKDFPYRQRFFLGFIGRISFENSPSWAAWTRSVATLQRSTARGRASATMAFLRAATEALRLRSSAPHWSTPR